nr:MAG TPA: hypothetical protein [Caudoviricetes sp.]
MAASVFSLPRSRLICSSAARLKNAFTLSPMAAAWVLIVSFAPLGSAIEIRSRFSASHFLLPSLRASVYFCGAVAITPYLLS